DYPLSVYLILVPPVILLTILPISLAGWGVREGALIGLFILILGADRSKVLSFSILYGLINIAVSLPGLYFYLNDKNKY
ncbi:MAG: lysylphosphatidylglycerol synthase domain-containing protein, partial [Desulfobulbaceae bacterium]|nr:lysylphosphatidylglycerol synthase domain-containing protein [Desulfobulbaceae bacterium]